MTERYELPEQARKIIQQECAKIGALLEKQRSAAANAAEALEAACTALNQRGRYSSITAEHYDRQDYDGIQVIDALDEQLVRCVRETLKSFVDRHRQTPALPALKFVTDKLAAGLRELPPYPVAYMILGAVHAAIDTFSALTKAGVKQDVAALEHALVHVLLGIVDKYVQTRERPMERHQSDIQREYVVVRRMKCACGEEKYEVALQALCHGPGGVPYDKLDLRCKSCGARRTVTFDLPFFKDLAKM